MLIHKPRHADICGDHTVFDHTLRMSTSIDIDRRRMPGFITDDLRLHSIKIHRSFFSARKPNRIGTIPQID